MSGKKTTKKDNTKYILYDNGERVGVYDARGIAAHTGIESKAVATYADYGSVCKHRYTWNRETEPQLFRHVCSKCGKSFSGRKRQRLCPECRKRQRNRQRRMQRKEEGSLSAFAAQARAHGMSYGQYSAKLYWEASNKYSGSR